MSVQPMMPLYALDGVFDPEATQAMGEAFDRTKHWMPASDAQEEIATRILEAARGGERDVCRLSAAALGYVIRV